MKKAKNIIAAAALSLVCVLSSVIALTGAWFTHTSDVESATITVGKAVTMEIDGTFNNATVLPGDNIQDFVSAKAVADETATSSMYVRAYVQVQGEVAGLLTVSSAGDDWVKYGNYFYYTKTVNELTASSTYSNLTVLNQGEETTNLNITVTVSEDATELTLEPGSTVPCKVVFQAIQSKNTGDLTMGDTVDWGTNPLESAQPTAVPNTGYVEKVYVNTALSTEQVTAMLDYFAEWDDNGRYVVVDESFKFLRLQKHAGVYLMSYNIDGNDVYIFASAHHFLCDFTGWSSDFNGEFLVESDVLDSYGDVDFGTDNELLKNLFSITPFN